MAIIAEATVAIIAEATVVMVSIITVAMVVILNLILFIPINRPVLKVGKIEAMEILLKTLNMKVAEAEGKEVLPMTVMLLARIISNPFFQVQKLI